MSADRPPLIFDRELVAWRRQRAFAGSRPPRFLWERVADDLVDRLQFIQRPFRDVLILGGHDGSIGRRVRALAGERLLVETEATPLLAAEIGPGTVVADEEALPFAEASFDLVLAPLTLQFVNDLPGVLIQIRRILRPDGLLLGAMLGGETLGELRAAWLAAESEVTGGASPRVAPFADVRDMGRLLQRAGFALPVADSDIVMARYDSALTLMAEVKAMGASNALAERRRVPVTRTLIARVAENYAERFAHPDGRIPATFEILTMTAWAPDASQQQPLKPGSAVMRLADVLGTTEGRFGDDAPDQDR